MVKESLSNDCVTVKDKDKNKDKDKDKDNRQAEQHSGFFTIDDFTNLSSKVGLSDEQCIAAYHHFKAQGFKRGNNLPIVDLESTLVTWKNNEHNFNKPGEPKGDIFSEIDKKQADQKQRLRQWEEREGHFVRNSPVAKIKELLGKRLQETAFRDWAVGQNPKLKEVV